MPGQRAPKSNAAQQGKTWDDFIICETENLRHLVRPTVWPPARIGNIAGDPSVSLACERCGAQCITYRRHATGELGGIEVIIPENAKTVTPIEAAPRKRRGGRPKKVQQDQVA